MARLNLNAEWLLDSREAEWGFTLLTGTVYVTSGKQARLEQRLGQIQIQLLAMTSPVRAQCRTPAPKVAPPPSSTQPQ